MVAMVLATAAAAMASDRNGDGFDHFTGLLIVRVDFDDNGNGGGKGFPFGGGDGHGDNNGNNNGNTDQEGDPRVLARQG
jgi:hypothetical protein